MYKMPKNNEERKKCISGKTWIGKNSKGKKRILIENGAWNKKCMRTFLKRSREFYEPMDGEDRLSKRIKKSSSKSIKNSAHNQFAVYVPKTALEGILKATRNALVAEENAGFHSKQSIFSERFTAEYKKAFEKEYSKKKKSVSLEVVEDDIIWTDQKNAERSCLFACAAPAKKVNSLAPFEGLLHVDLDGYECCVYTDAFIKEEVEELLKYGLNARDAKPEKVRNEFGTDEDFKSNRLQVPLEDEESVQLLADLKKKGIVHEDYEFQIPDERRCQMLGNAPGRLEEQQMHQDNKGNAMTGGDLVNVLVALDLMYLTMYRVEDGTWYKKDVWLTPGSVLCLSGYAARGGMGALRNPGKNDWYTHTPKRIHLYLKRTENPELGFTSFGDGNDPLLEEETGSLQTEYLSGINDFIDETNDFWQKVGKRLKRV